MSRLQLLASAGLLAALASPAGASKRFPHGFPPCYAVDCAPLYTLGGINASVAGSAAMEHRAAWQAALVSAQETAAQACKGLRHSGVIGGTAQATGGYCLDEPRPWTKTTVLATGAEFRLPIRHVAADRGIVAILGREVAMNGLTLNDFGAGVGQYGAAVAAYAKVHGTHAHGGFKYTGYDGAGNIGTMTDGAVRFFDLTIPLKLPRADWLLNLEVGEHIPHEKEEMVFRNIHAHNCVGVVLSWAVLKQWGHCHVNNHAVAYVKKQMHGLGYYVDEGMTQELNGNVDEKHAWYKNAQNIVAYRRYTPITGDPSCNHWKPKGWEAALDDPPTASGARSEPGASLRREPGSGGNAERAGGWGVSLALSLFFLAFGTLQQAQ